ncbi:MAG: hypothetical protein MUC87_18620 [Bacteroidia bacterium]|jgi:hypothetical protein|nr:hypothetical protein [Bacteroidia bacterium]
MQRVQKLMLAAGCLLLSLCALAQGKVMRFNQLAEKGVSIAHLDSTYKSAVHSDTSLAVFKSEAETAAFIDAYIKFIRDFGAFLKENGFGFGQAQSAFNRVYFASDGSVDYFVYSFSNSKLAKEDQLTETQIAEFERLLGLFIASHKLTVTADVSFSQCSPVVYPGEK